MAGHPIVHIDISAKDTAAASKFYAELCGWHIDFAPDFTYYQFRGDGGPGGGFVKVDGQMYKQGDILLYIAADDIEAFLKKAATLGGKTLQPKTEIPGVGWFALFADPSGNRMGVFTAKNLQG